MRVLLAVFLGMLTINGARAERPSFQIAEEMRAIYSRRGVPWTITCEDVRAIVTRVGEEKAASVARALGAGESQVEVARQCLTKKTKK